MPTLTKSSRCRGVWLAKSAMSKVSVLMAVLTKCTGSVFVAVLTSTGTTWSTERVRVMLSE